MKIRTYSPLRKFFSFFMVNLFLAFTYQSYGQSLQGFFLDSWQPRTISSPAYIDAPQTTHWVNTSIKINFSDTLEKIPVYIFGNNANSFTGSMSDNQTLMKNMTNLDMGIMRGPSGSISDVYFWNRYDSNPPTDVPSNLSLWYGKRQSWASWSMDVDSFYHILSQIKATGIITVNYGYARYGTSMTPVAQAAHLAADWVRYDKGRSRYWEIGNENFGNWEAGYQIDKNQNKDGQPEYITGELYGKHALVFIDSMKAAATQVGADIKIGLVVTEASSTSATWNQGVFSQAGDKADFYSVHSYYTPYNQNSTADVILNSYSLTGEYKDYIRRGLLNAGKPQRPVALTEYNIFAQGSMQPVSHTNGLHAILVMGEAIKTGYGAAIRWDLANGWDDGNDMGLFSYGSEPGVETYAPRPAFYHMYFFRKFMGDVLIKNTVSGSSDIVVYSSRFSSGQASAAIVNKGHAAQTVRLNIENFGFGDRYYTYKLTGGTDNGDFSRKTYVNGSGPNGVAGGPFYYEAVKPFSSAIGDEIRLDVPALSAVMVLVENGSKTLTINDSYSPLAVKEVKENSNSFECYPNPAHDYIQLSSLKKVYQRIEIVNITGQVLISGTEIIQDEYRLPLSLPAGIYFVKLYGNGQAEIKRIVIE